MRRRRRQWRHRARVKQGRNEAKQSARRSAPKNPRPKPTGREQGEGEGQGRGEGERGGKGKGEGEGRRGRARQRTKDKGKGQQRLTAYGLRLNERGGTAHQLGPQQRTTQVSSLKPQASSLKPRPRRLLGGPANAIQCCHDLTEPHRATARAARARPDTRHLTPLSLFGWQWQWHVQWAA